ncbi:DNA-binding transcriptional regulator, PucR family [Actinokineospora globicatena]|nr:DNA-binding transcriptional regulator, PucR family [Actinokineospora globicatena]
MVDRLFDADSTVLALLELLSNNAPQHEFDALVARAADAGMDVAALEHARRLALTIADQLNRYRQREADFSALVDTAREFTVVADVDSLLKMITRRTRLLLGVDMAYISFPDGDSIYIRTADGHTSVLSVGLRLPGNGGLGNKVLASSAPFWTADYLNDDRIDHSPEIDEVVEAEGLRTIMAVPLFYGNKPSGALYAGSRRVRRFTADQVSLMSSLGDLAGVAIERARVQEHEQLRERQSAAETTAGAVRDFSRVHARMLELVIGGADLKAVFAEAHQHLGGGLRLCAANSDVLVALGDLPCEDHESLIGAMVQAQSAREPVRQASGLWTMPLYAGNRHFGALLVRPEHEPGEFELGLVQVAAHAATAYLLLDDRAGASEDQIRDELLDDLLAQPQRPPQQLRKRALRMGMDLTKPHVVVVARPTEDALGKISVWASSYSHRCGGLKTLHRDCAVLLIPGDDPDAAVRAVFDSATASLRQSITVSASSPVEDAASVFHGHREAVRCMEAMTALGMTNRASSARQLGFLGILLSDHHDVDAFVHSVLGPVLDYDQLRTTELTRTLEAYFEEGSSPTYAAKKLHVHANTVARRLERITELLGPEWQQPAQALEVQLALRLNRVRSVLDQGGHPGAPEADPGDQLA